MHHQNKYFFHVLRVGNLHFYKYTFWGAVVPTRVKWSAFIKVFQLLYRCWTYEAVGIYYDLLKCVILICAIVLPCSKTWSLFHNFQVCGMDGHKPCFWHWMAQIWPLSPLLIFSIARQEGPCSRIGFRGFRALHDRMTWIVIVCKQLKLNAMWVCELEIWTKMVRH